MINHNYPDPVVLESEQIRLEPLTMEHASDLQDACQDGNLWEITVTSVPEPANVEAYIQKALDMPDRLAFAVIDKATGKAIGSTSYHDILPQVRRLEIGYTWYAKRFWRSHVNTACKKLLLTHAFDTLGYHVVGWRTDGENFRSQAAIERLGAKKDGIIRGNRIRRDGAIADTVMYSMTADEWRNMQTIQAKNA